MTIKRWLIGFLVLICSAYQVYAMDEEHIIYRVYIDDQVIGVLSDESVYEEYQDEKMKMYLSDYSEEQIIAPPNVRIEEELTFVSYQINDEEVLEKISAHAKFKIDAYNVTVGTSSFCVEEIEEVQVEIQKIMEIFVGEERLELLLDLTTEIAPLEKTGEQIVGVKFDPSVEYTKSICNIDDLVSKEEIGNVILTGSKSMTETTKLELDNTVSDMIEDADLTLKMFELLNYRTINNHIPYIGQEFNVTPIKEDVKIQVETEVVKEEIIAYETEIIEDDTLPEGEMYTEQSGQNGVNLTTYLKKEVNGELIDEVKISEKVLTESLNRIIVEGTKVIPNRGTQDWKWPTTRTTITCGYLCYSGHYAIDIAGYIGQPIFAADNGVVIGAGYEGGYGYTILINHNNGYYSRYAHLNSIGVSIGQVVQGGQTIGGLGNTGNSTGPHLHFEIRTNTLEQPSYAPNPLSFY